MGIELDKKNNNNMGELSERSAEEGSLLQGRQTLNRVTWTDYTKVAVVELQYKKTELQYTTKNYNIYKISMFGMAVRSS